MKPLRCTIIVLALVAGTAFTAEARSRTSLHIGIGVPFWSPFFYAPSYVYVPPPPVVYVPPPPARYFPREREVIRKYMDGDCRVTERKLYDIDGVMIDRQTRRDCRDSDSRWLEEDQE